jgi:hypothetical protein
MRGRTGPGRTVPRAWAGAAALLLACGCGPGGGGVGGGAPALGVVDVPMDLTQDKVVTAPLLVASVLSAAPPGAVDQTGLGVSALPKAGDGGAVPGRAKVVAGTGCPVVDVLNHDPEAPGPLPAVLELLLTFTTADGGRCVAGDTEDLGTVELSVTGASALVNGALQAAAGETLTVSERYADWRRKVTGTDGGVTTYAFGGFRTVRRSADGTTRVTTDPEVSRWSVVRDAMGMKTAERFYRVTDLDVTRAPAAGVGGPDTAYTQTGTLTAATSATGHADVTLSGVRHDPGLCGGLPTGGTMTFRSGGRTLIVDFDGPNYAKNPDAYCGRAYFTRPVPPGQPNPGPQLENYVTPPYVL